MNDNDNHHHQQQQQQQQQEQKQILLDQKLYLAQANQHRNKGSIAFDKEKYDDAIVCYKKCLKLREGLNNIGCGRYYDKDTVQLYWYIGCCYEEKKEYDIAFQYYHAWLRLRRLLPIPIQLDDGTINSNSKIFEEDGNRSTNSSHLEDILTITTEFPNKTSSIGSSLSSSNTDNDVLPQIYSWKGMIRCFEQIVTQQEQQYYQQQQQSNPILSTTIGRMSSSSSSSSQPPIIIPIAIPKTKMNQLKDLYDSNLKLSIQYEQIGDKHRINGEFNKAIENYTIAIQIEERYEKECFCSCWSHNNNRTLNSIPTDNNTIVIAFLWRKICIVHGIITNNNNTKKCSIKNHYFKNWKQQQYYNQLDYTFFIKKEKDNNNGTTKKISTTTNNNNGDVAKIITTTEKENCTNKNVIVGLVSNPTMLKCIRYGDSLFSKGKFKEAIQQYQQQVLTIDYDSSSTNKKKQNNTNQSRIVADNNINTIFQQQSSSSSSSTSSSLLTSSTTTLHHQYQPKQQQQQRQQQLFSDKNNNSSSSFLLVPSFSMDGSELTEPTAASTVPLSLSQEFSSPSNSSLPTNNNTNTGNCIAADDTATAITTADMVGCMQQLLQNQQVIFQQLDKLNQTQQHVQDKLNNCYNNNNNNNENTQKEKRPVLSEKKKKNKKRFSSSSSVAAASVTKIPSSILKRKKIFGNNTTSERSINVNENYNDNGKENNIPSSAIKRLRRW